MWIVKYEKMQAKQANEMPSECLKGESGVQQPI